MSQDIDSLIQQAWPELSALGVEHLDVFGSHARGEATEASDVDVIVHLREPATLRVLVAVRELLTTRLGRRVDVLTPGALAHRPRLRARVEAEARRVA